MRLSINLRALRMIEEALVPILRSRKDIRNMNLVVSFDSELANAVNIDTRYGALVIRTSPTLGRGYAYLIERPLTRGGQSFAWVAKPKVAAKEKRA